jgi:hypothetical protein
MEPARWSPAGMTQDHPTDEATRRRIRRNTVLLAIVAVGIYVAFVVSSMLHGLS